MKALLSVLLAVVVGLAFLLYRQQSTIREQQKRLEELAKQQSDRSDPKPTLEYQEKCAEQARQTFRDIGYAEDESVTYEDHYNAKLDKCFILIRNVDAKGHGTIWTYKTLLDAHEGRTYGNYRRHSVKGTFLCKVLLPSGEPQFCESDDEFTELIKIYMENGVARLPIAPSQIDPLTPPGSKLRF